MAGTSRRQHGGGAANLEVIGLRELNRALRKCSKEAKKEVRAAARKAGNVVRDEIKRRAPRKTGALKRSVKTQVRRLNVRVFSDARKTSRAWPGGYRYGKRLEFDPGYGGRYAFFYPGYEAKRDEAVQEFDNVLAAVERAFDDQQARVKVRSGP